MSQVLVVAQRERILMQQTVYAPGVTGVVPLAQGPLPAKPVHGRIYLQPMVRVHALCTILLIPLTKGVPAATSHVLPVMVPQ